MPRREFNGWKKRDAFRPQDWHRDRLYSAADIARIAALIPNVPEDRRKTTRQLLSLVLTCIEPDLRSLNRPAKADRAHTLDVLRDALKVALSKAHEANDDSLAALYVAAEEDDQHPADIELSQGSGRWRVEEDLVAVQRLIGWADRAARTIETGPSEAGRAALEPETDAVAAIRQIWHFMSKEKVSRTGVTEVARALLGPIVTEYRGKPPDLRKAVRAAFAKRQPAKWPIRDEFKHLAQGALPK